MRRGVFASILASMIIVLLFSSSVPDPFASREPAIPRAQQLQNDFSTAINLLDQNTLALFIPKINGATESVNTIVLAEKNLWRIKFENMLFTTSTLSRSTGCAFFQNPSISQPSSTSLRVIFWLECYDTSTDLRIQRIIQFDKSVIFSPTSNGYQILANNIVQYEVP